MELVAPGLLWVDDYTDRCPLSGGPVGTAEVTLEVEGIDEPPFEIELGWSAEAACHLGLLEDLFEIADEAGQPPWAPTGFRIDGAPVAAAVHVTEPGLTLPWAAFVEKMATAVAQAERPPPTPAEVRALPRFEETWELAVREVDEAEGEHPPLWLAVVVDAGGEIRATALRAGRPGAEALAEVVCEATRARPEVGLTAGRPARVRTAEAEGLAALRRRLEDARIAAEAGPTPLADEVAETLSIPGAPAGQIPVPLLGRLSDADLQALVDAARGFFGATPWDRLSPDRYLAVRLDGGPWVYASVMGQDGEEYGLSCFDDWLGLCRFLSNVPPPGGSAAEALSEVGPVDGLTLYAPGALHDADAERLRATGPPVFRGMYPAGARFTARDEVGPSAWPVDLHIALLTALPEVLAARRATTVTSITADVETPRGRLTIRYPAMGTEALPTDAPAVALVVDPVASNMTPLPEDRRLRVEGPAGARLPQVNRAVRDVLDWGRIRALELDGHMVWDETALADDPAPSLDDLAGARSIRVWLGAEIHTARARRLKEPRETITAEVVRP